MANTIRMLIKKSGHLVFTEEIRFFALFKARDPDRKRDPERNLFYMIVPKGFQVSKSRHSQMKALHDILLVPYTV